MSSALISSEPSNAIVRTREKCRGQEILAGLAHEERPAVGEIASGELPELGELADAIRRGDEPATRT